MPDALTPEERETRIEKIRRKAQKKVFHGSNDAQKQAAQRSCDDIAFLLDTLTAEREAHRQGLHDAWEKGGDVWTKWNRAIMYAEGLENIASKNIPPAPANPYTTPTTNQG